MGCFFFLHQTRSSCLKTELYFFSYVYSANPNQFAPMTKKYLLAPTRIVMLSALMLFTYVSYSQYTLKKGALPDVVSLHPYTTIVDVGQKKLSLDDILATYGRFHPQRLKTENDDLGFTNHSWWAQVKLQNTTDDFLTYYLETARPITDLAELYIIDTKTGLIKKNRSGDGIPCPERDFDHRKTIFRVDFKPHSELHLFLHLKSDGEVISMPILLHSPQQFISETAKEQLLFGFFYGILALASLLYVFFYFALRERTFLYYSLYVLFIGLLQFSLDGYFYQLIAPDGGWFAGHCVLFFALVAAIFLGKYGEVFLKIRQVNQTLYRFFNGLYIMSVISLLLLIFVPSGLSLYYPLTNIIGLLVLFLIIFSIAYLRLKKVPVDVFFRIGIIFLILGFTIFILNNFGKIPTTFLTQHSSKIGTGIEVIFLSLSMGNLIRKLRNEKIEYNRLALVRSEEMSELKSYFLSNISHELRTPLNAIMNLSDTISKDTSDEKIKANTQIIKYSSHSLLSSVNDILDFSKIEKGELQLETTTFEPAKVLGHLKNNAANRAKDQGLDFQYSISEAIPDFVLGDVTRLAQVVNNVLSNAIKFTPNGFVRFEVDAKLKPKNKASLILTISDSGIGIAEEKLTSIFDSFSQNNINNKRKYGGLGLGLYIVKTLVEMQNGSIKMSSVVDKGSTCTITIDYDVVIREKNPVMEEIPEVFDLEGKTILVVEDNAINQMVIKMIAKKWVNATMIYANNGQEGLDAFKTHSIDLVLMDLQMPVMDGYEATIAIRNGEAGEAHKNIPIIAVTADVMETTKMRVAEIGMNDYLSKPIKNDTLFAAIKALV